MRMKPVMSTGFVVAFLIVVVVTLLSLTITDLDGKIGQNGNLTVSNSTNSVNSVMVILVPGFLWEDYNNYNLNNFEKLLEYSAVGLMNTTVTRPYHPSSAYLSLGTGVRSTSCEISGAIYNPLEKYNGYNAKKFYQRHTGLDVELEEESAIAVEYPLLKTKNKDQDYNVEIGKLAAILEENNVDIIYHGNADTYGKKRYGGLLAINETGVISQGIVTPEKTLTVKDSFPFSYKTDYDKTYTVAEEIFQDKAENEKSFLYILELGDGTRIDDYEKERLDEKIRENLVAKTLKNIDGLLGQISSLRKEKDFDLILLNPAPSHENYHEGKRLTPILYSPGGDLSRELDGNILVSNTTKRDGLVANMDLSPTILEEFDIDISPKSKGNRIETTSAPGLNEVDGEITSLISLNDKLINTFNVRPSILKNYIIAQVFVMVLGLLAVIIKYKIPYLNILLYAMLISPLGFILAPYFSIFSLWGLAVFVLVISVGGSILGLKLTASNIWRLGIICLVTSIAILLPFIIGSENIIYTGVLSHDPISGARYYGLGNELMGVLIGSFTMGFFSLYTIKPEWKNSYYILGLLLVFYFFHPGFGANFGGGVSAAVAFLGILYIFLKDNHQKQVIYIFLGFLILIIGAFLGFNLLLDEVTHLGRAIRLAIAEGPAELLPIITRKISMNLTLLRYSDWSIVFLSFLAVLFLKLLKFTSVMDNLNHNYPILKRGLVGVVFGGITAFLINDSGVVAAATMLLYVSVPLLILGLEN